MEKVKKSSEKKQCDATVEIGGIGRGEGGDRKRVESEEIRRNKKKKDKGLRVGGREE